MRTDAGEVEITHRLQTAIFGNLWETWGMEFSETYATNVFPSMKEGSMSARIPFRDLPPTFTACSPLPSRRPLDQRFFWAGVRQLRVDHRARGADQHAADQLVLAARGAELFP